jgi:hypothetical protein
MVRVSVCHNKIKNRLIGGNKYGATIGARTRDLILTMDALYQLSYRGKIVK